MGGVDCLLPPTAQSVAVHEKRKKQEVGGGGGGRGGAELLITAQQLHAQSDAPVPLPREDADVSSVDRRIEDVLLVDVIVAVSWKNLTKGKKVT